ncbi:DUF4105 domain-containing protein [Phytopseudomonas daroniae]|uniref:DUF7844 domain-containing protein n=1 Tax=Phytopseudomonas daroniae TaxID=2487519 RepID=UPI0010384D25|nr:DUF4105 domain-containing protein [Pseudomonas daroniae]TBU78406.1 hypothetical protein DNK10_01295 [Pseudomonas daroniae]
MPPRGWFLLLTLLVSTTSNAQLKLTLDESLLNSAERQASQALLDEALEAMPPQLREALDRTVTVRWVPLPEQIYGRAGRLSGVELNAGLLSGLTDGSAAHTVNGRPHGTVRRELLATVLHEVAHLYDRGTYWGSEQRLLLRRCQRQNSNLGAVGLPAECRGQTERRFTLSDDPRLLDLAGWPQRVGTRGQRDQHNGQVARSPDSYELSNPREFVAVNMEYFLLDPEYACRRPSLARFFSEHFGWSPANGAPCGTGYAYLNAGRDFDKQALANLDPERVYEVDYLLAEANQNMASRWGHSMLRLVICAPGRPRGPDCRLDLDQHLVLSYRAFVGDVQLSSWDGLTGAYPSRLFVLPLAQVIEEYTKVELRSLASVPLTLPRERLEQLVARAVEQHWSYDGDYFFVSNNCAVETLKLLRSGTDLARLQDLDSITPIGLLEVLEARGLADSSMLDDSREALRLGYRFDSFRDRYQAMFKVLQQRLPIRQQQVEDWLEQPSSERRQWFEQADLRASAAMLLLEQAAMRRQLLLSQDELKQRYLTGRAAKDPNLDKAGDALEQILAGTGFLSRPAELLEGGYGLPQQGEWQRLESETRNRQQQLSLLSADLDEEVRRLLEPQRLAELEANEANLKLLGEHLRKLHKASGGLQL